MYVFGKFTYVHECYIWRKCIHKIYIQYNNINNFKYDYLFWKLIGFRPCKNITHETIGVMKKPKTFNSK